MPGPFLAGPPHPVALVHPLRLSRQRARVQLGMLSQARGMALKACLSGGGELARGGGENRRSQGRGHTGRWGCAWGLVQRFVVRSAFDSALWGAGVHPTPGIPQTHQLP